MKLILTVDKLGLIIWYVYALYAIHAYCKEQMGALMTFGKGVIVSFSWKQKINTKSSTEAKLVGAVNA